MESEISINIKDDDNLTTLLTTYRSIQTIKKELLMNEEKIKNKVKIFLKEHKWEKYLDEGSNISIKLLQGKSETFDKAQLRLMLTEQQYFQALKVTAYEKLIILTPEDRERLTSLLKK